ncbi:hypothetical protein B4081_3743 [Bacillus cereus]|nr:hypothetical protein B4081_3743 [Bacillus cereus]
MSTSTLPQFSFDIFSNTSFPNSLDFKAFSGKNKIVIKKIQIRLPIPHRYTSNRPLHPLISLIISRSTISPTFFLSVESFLSLNSPKTLSLRLFISSCLLKVPFLRCLIVLGYFLIIFLIFILKVILLLKNIEITTSNATNTIKLLKFLFLLLDFRKIRNPVPTVYLYIKELYMSVPLYNNIKLLFPY